MSVYTTIGATQLESLLREYPLGTLKQFSGIEAGIENSNYFVRTTSGEYVLTIFEHSTVDDLQFDLQLMEHMARADIPCPLPLHRRDGELLSTILDKPAAFVSKLAGRSPDRLTRQHCIEIGHWLARLHIAGQGFALSRATARDLNWASQVTEALKPRITEDQYAIIQRELAYLSTVPRQQLPQGIIHSDLFSDNVLFSGDRLTGLLDLYDASVDCLLYDLAVAANAWCSQDDGSFDRDRLAALLTAYQQVRPLTTQELVAWPSMTRAAALRFWLSRLHHREFQPVGDLTQVKPPEVYEKILYQRQSEPSLTPVSVDNFVDRLKN